MGGSGLAEEHVIRTVEHGQPRILGDFLESEIVIEEDKKGVVDRAVQFIFDKLRPNANFLLTQCRFATTNGKIDEYLGSLPCVTRNSHSLYEYLIIWLQLAGYHLF